MDKDGFPAKVCVDLSFLDGLLQEAEGGRKVQQKTVVLSVSGGFIYWSDGGGWKGEGEMDNKRLWFYLFLMVLFAADGVDKDLHQMARHETESDRAFRKFKKRIAGDPDQVVRFQRAGASAFIVLVSGAFSGRPVY